jgi:hypothetical protein
MIELSRRRMFKVAAATVATALTPIVINSPAAAAPSPWLGSRRIAFIPTFQTGIDTAPDDAYFTRMFARIFSDFDESTGVDRSLAAYIHTISYGKATLEGRLFPAAWSNDARTREAGLNSLPPNHGYEYACVILPSGGLNRTGFAWWDDAPINGIRNSARVNMMEGLGTWAMEVLHMTTRVGDLYYTDPQLGRFDNMACSCGTHPTVHTKLLMGWIAGGLASHLRGTTSQHQLHAVGLPTTPPPGRVIAVRIPARASLRHFIVEARFRVDPYERATALVSVGIPSEGVIVYEVAGDTEVYLRTPTALDVGQSYENETEGFQVSVTSASPGWRGIEVRSRESPECTSLRARIRHLREIIETSRDPEEVMAARRALRQASERAYQLGCVI